MDDFVSANDAVASTGGTAPISDRRWFGTVAGNYGVSFDVTKNGTTLPMRAFGDECLNRGFIYVDFGSRKMEGDLHTYGSNYDFTINFR